MLAWAPTRTVSGLAVILITKDCSPRVHSLGRTLLVEVGGSCLGCQGQRLVLLLMTGKVPIQSAVLVDKRVTCCARGKGFVDGCGSAGPGPCCRFLELDVSYFIVAQNRMVFTSYLPSLSLAEGGVEQLFPGDLRSACRSVPLRLPTESDIECYCRAGR